MNDQDNSKEPMPQRSKLPRVAITYCTQCKWLLRAAYFAQELLSTFSTSIGEVALIPSTGGTFTVHVTPQVSQTASYEEVLIWDRKSDGGFPETKILKQRVRDLVEPERNLGHSDTPSSSKNAQGSIPSTEVKTISTLEGDTVVGVQELEKPAVNDVEVQGKCEKCE